MKKWIITKSAMKVEKTETARIGSPPITPWLIMGFISSHPQQKFADDFHQIYPICS